MIINSTTQKEGEIRFWSSVQYNGIMKPITDELCQLGYEARHKFLIPSSSYRRNRGLLSQMILRMNMYIFYPLYFFLYELFSPSAICVICTNTFYVPFLSTFIKRRKRKSVHLIYDLFPDALVSSESIPQNGLTARTLAKIVNMTIRRSDANVALGKKLKSHIIESHSIQNLISVIPVGTSCDMFDGLETSPESTSDKIGIFYCGNFGHLHDFKTLSDFFSKSVEISSKFHFQFSGHGHGMKCFKESLPSQLQNAPTFTSGLAEKDWIEAMTSNQIGLVTMATGAEEILMPSKTYSAMAAGQAILAICPSNSDLAELIREHDCGWHVEPGESKKLCEVLGVIVEDRELLLKKRNNAKQAAQVGYNSRSVAKQWSELFESLSPVRCLKL